MHAVNWPKRVFDEVSIVCIAYRCVKLWRRKRD